MEEVEGTTPAITREGESSNSRRKAEPMDKIFMAAISEFLKSEKEKNSNEKELFKKGDLVKMEAPSIHFYENPGEIK
ncbi:hypothetical protein A2U01_0052840, partial [Trifolium medium]|nr:hypothetical protein [Trifolium medium]